MTLLGILSGFTPMFAIAPTAALSAHRIGIVQGALLLALAAVWPALGSPSRGFNIAKYCAVVGLYANWLGTQLAAFWSAKTMFIVTGASMPPGAQPWVEVIVAILLITSGLVIATCVAILWKLRN